MVAIIVNVDSKELMSAVFDNLWVSSSPWLSRYAYGDYVEGMTVAVSYDLPEDDEGEGNGRAEVHVNDLARGLKIVMDKKYHHCGGVVSYDMDDWDACVADMILQCALMGELVYG